MDGKLIALMALAGAFACSAAVLFVLLGESSAENIGLREEVSSLKANLSAAQSGLNMTKAELERKNGDILVQQDEIANLTHALGNRTAEAEGLKRQLNESMEELEETKNTLEEAREDIKKIKDEALAIEEQINDSIQWFKANSALPPALKADRFANRAEKGCEDDGRLNLACVSYLLEDELGFSYKDDPTGDRLYSIAEIISRKGGDCEDYSLFFKAYLNRLEGESLEIEAWAPGFGKYVVYEDADSGKYWYYDNAAGRVVGRTGQSRPYAACYFFDTQGDLRIGHCVIMLSNRTIESPGDITEKALAGSALFEPQDGRYLGSIGDGFSVCEQGDEGCDFKDYALAFIITDSDLFQFSGGNWSYYEGQREEVRSLLESLEEIGMG